MEVDELCEKAIEIGIEYLSITDHYEMDGIIYDFYAPYSADEAKNKIMNAKEKYNKRLKLTYGIELGQAVYFKDEAKKFLDRYNFEFVIGSIHALKDVPDFCYMRYDWLPKELSNILWGRLLDEMYNLVLFGNIHALGHFTYPTRYMMKYGFKLEFKNYYDKIIQIFKKIIEKGICLEVNTSGMRQELNDSMPNPELLKIYKELGGKLITCGSDAHKAEHLGMDIDIAYKMLSDLGFKYVTVFHDGKQVHIKIP